MTIIYAPFSSTQVAALENWQRSGVVHPFTCPHRTDGAHEQRYGDLGALVPETSGWFCPDCGYSQLWCHDFMLNVTSQAIQEDSQNPNSAPESPAGVAPDDQST